MQRKKKRPSLLSSTRPSGGRSAASLSSRTTRALVRSHHTLRKKLHTAKIDHNEEEAQKLKEQITGLGGLEAYQKASIQGQAVERGGDSSKILVEWLKELGVQSCRDRETGPLKMLEIGALRVDNACARCGLFDMERIDLNSQHALIKQEDFMERPLPTGDSIVQDGFDIISLSLVLNFVDDAAKRGQMLRRIRQFLKNSYAASDKYSEAFPSLFLVLPAPCIANSRYLDAAKFKAIMESLGFSIVKSKTSAKLVYYLFRYQKVDAEQRTLFKKEEIKSGKMRNNFAIVLK